MLGGRKITFVLALGATVAIAALGPGPVAQASPIVTIADENATASVDLGLSDGMYEWTVDGVNHLHQQWFWLGVDGGPVVSVDTLGSLVYATFDTDFDGVDDRLSAAYSDGSVGFNALWTIQGSSPGTLNSIISESLGIVNETSAPIEVKFFQYSDFDLAGSPTDTSVWIQLPDNAIQTGPGVVMSETVVVPDPNHYEAGFAGPVLASVLGGGLADIAGPVGPGDLAWAFEWDFTLAPGNTFLISKVKVIPEPATVLLCVAGLAVLSTRRRR